MSSIIQQQDLISRLQFGSAGLQVNMSDPAFIRRINEAERMAHVAVKTGVTQEEAPFGMPAGLWNFFGTAADLMSRWNYGVAGFIDTLQGTGEEGENPFARFGREAFSGIGGLQGDKETFGDVLEQAGIGDISISQLLTGQDRDWIFDPGLRGITGFSLDVATDPLSWVANPAGALGKGMKVLTGTGLTRTLNGRGMKLMNNMLDEEIEAARKFYNIKKSAGRQAVLQKIAKDERWFDAMVDRGFGQPTKLKGLNTIEEGVDRGVAGALQVEDRLFEMVGQRVAKEGGEAVLEKEGLRFRPFRIGNFDPLGIDVPVYVDDVLARMYDATMKQIERGVKKMFPDNGFVNALGKGHDKTLDFMNDLFFVNSRLSRKDPYYVLRDSRRRTMVNAAKGRADQYSSKVFQGVRSMKLSEEDNKVFHMFLAEDVEGTLPKPKEIKASLKEYGEIVTAAREALEATGEGTLNDYIYEFLQRSKFFSDLGIDDTQKLKVHVERMTYFNHNFPKFRRMKSELSMNHKLFKSELNYQQMVRRFRRTHEAMGEVEVRARFLEPDVVTKGGRYWPRDHSLLSEEDKRILYNNVRDPKLVRSNVGTYYEDRRAFNHWGYVRGMEMAGFGHRVNWNMEEVFANRMKTHYQQMINRDFVEDMVIRYGAKSELMRNAKVASVTQEVATARARGEIDPEDIRVAEEVLDRMGNNDLYSIKQMIMDDLDNMGTFDDVSIEKAVNRAVEMVTGSRELAEKELEATRRTIAGNLRGVLRDAEIAHRDVARMVVDNNLLEFQPGELMDVVRRATPERMERVFADFNELQMLLRLQSEGDPAKIMQVLENSRVKKGPVYDAVLERARMFAVRERTAKPAAKPTAEAAPKPAATKPAAKPSLELKDSDYRKMRPVSQELRDFMDEVKATRNQLDNTPDVQGSDYQGAFYDLRAAYKGKLTNDEMNLAIQGKLPDDIKVGETPKILTDDAAARVSRSEFEAGLKEVEARQPQVETPSGRKAMSEIEGRIGAVEGEITFEQMSRAIDEIVGELRETVVAEARDLTRMVMSVHKLLKTNPQLRNIPKDVSDQAFQVALRETIGAIGLKHLPKNHQDFIEDLLGLSGRYLEFPVDSMPELMTAMRQNKKIGMWTMMRQMDRMFEGNEELLDAFMKGDLPEESLADAMREVMKILGNVSKSEENMGAFNLMLEVGRLQMRYAENVDDLMTVKLRHAYSDALDTIFHDMDVLAREQRLASGRDMKELNAAFHRLPWSEMENSGGIYDYAKMREFMKRWDGMNENQQKVVVAELTKRVHTKEEASNLFSFLNDIEWFKKMEISDEFAEEIAAVPAFTNKIGKGNKILTLQTSNGKLAVELPDYMVDDMQRQLTASINDPQLANFLKFVVWGNNVFKANVTRYFPSFNMRNIGSNFVQSIADAGFAILNPRLWKSAYHVIRGDFDAAARLKNGLRLNELAREMDAAGLITDPDLWTEVGKGGLNLPTDMPKWLLDKTIAWRKGRMGSGFLDKLATLHKMPSFAESHARILHYLALREGGMGAQQALEHVNRFLFDYALLTGAEKKAFKNIFPFYTWTRKNIELQFRLLKEKPFVASVQTKLFADRDRPESASLPDYLRGEYPIRLFSREDKVQFLSGLDIPLRNMDAVWAGSIGQTFREHVNLMTPLIKYPVEFFYGKDTFGEETRGHGRIRERIGAAIERRYPKKMKDWLDFEVQTMPDGRKQYFADRTMLYMLNKALFMSRWSNESLRVEEFATQFGQGDTEKGAVGLVKFLTGLSYREFDFTEAQRRAIYNNSSRLMDLLSDRGWMREFTTKYWSPQAKQALYGGDAK